MGAMVGRGKGTTGGNVDPGNDSVVVLTVVKIGGSTVGKGVTVPDG